MRRYSLDMEQAARKQGEAMSKARAAEKDAERLEAKNLELAREEARREKVAEMKAEQREAKAGQCRLTLSDPR